MQEKINQALSELKKFNLPWQEMVQRQLEYCLEVEQGKSSTENLIKLNIGLVSVREIDEREPLYKLLTKIQYEMQRKYLSADEKVQLNIFN